MIVVEAVDPLRAEDLVRLGELVAGWLADHPTLLRLSCELGGYLEEALAWAAALRGWDYSAESPEWRAHDVHPASSC